MADRRDGARSKDRTSTKYATKKAATERIAAQRAVQQRKERQRRLMLVGTSALVVVGVVVALIVVATTGKSGTKTPAVQPASTTVTDAITKAAGMTSNTPQFSLFAPPSTVNGGAALNGSNGKPEVLYVGAEYCPNCAATRWPAAIALSRFGTFSNLKMTYSSEDNIPTLSFYGASYTSQYIDGVLKEDVDQNSKPLDPLTSQETSLFTSLGGGGYPFIDFAGKWVQKGSSLNPTDFSKLSPDDVANAITDQTSKLGKEILASADVFTAIICETTGSQPASVCSAAGVKAAESALHAGG